MIIDAFGEIRDQKTRNEEDQKNVCFICGIERSEFERNTNFEEHVVNEHNIWAYVNYIVFLDEKKKNDKNNMTDIENPVLDKYSVKDFGWIPIGKSLTLENIYEREKVKKVNEFDILTKEVRDIKTSLTEMSTMFKNTTSLFLKNK